MKEIKKDRNILNIICGYKLIKDHSWHRDGGVRNVMRFGVCCQVKSDVSHDLSAHK